MKPDEFPTPVVFRKFRASDGGDIIAIFPDQLGTNDPRTCGSYLHVGQHGACDPLFLMRETYTATPADYAKLKAELESIGYRLRVIKAIHSNFYDSRVSQLLAIKNTARGAA